MSDTKSKENCCGQYPAMWRILFSHSIPIRVDDGSGSGDTDFSHMETRNGQFDVIAISADLAQAAFVVDHPPTIYTRLTNPELICYVDAIVHIGKSYGGHFS